MIFNQLKKARSKLMKMSHEQHVLLGVYGVTAVAGLFLLLSLASIFKSV